MRGILFSLLGVFLVTLLATPTLGSGWGWDTANGLGFMAFGGLLYLCVSSGAGFSARAHQTLGFIVLGAATAHVFTLLIIDPAVIEYVKPGAPIYMWVGVIAFVAFSLLILVGLPEYRLKLYKRYNSFRFWHRILAIAAIVGAGYHVAASGFYLRTGYQLALFTLGTAAILIGYRTLLSTEPVSRSASVTYLLAGLICVALFAAVRNIPV